MTPEESAQWVSANKRTLREVERLTCPCKAQPRAMYIVYIAPDGRRVLWTGRMQHVDQDGAVAKSGARATDLDKVPAGLVERIELVQCPGCRRGALLHIKDGLIKVHWLLGAPTRAAVTEG